MSETTKPRLSAVAIFSLNVLRIRAAEIASRIDRGRYGGSLQDDEWWSYSHEFRLCAVMIAGIDGDTKALVSQRWQKFTVPERDALKAALRSLRRGAEKVKVCVL